MKKLAWMFAALSLCSFAFTACGDDDDDSGKAKNGEACEAAEDCESSYCNEKVCAEKPAADEKKAGEEGGACLEGDKCNDGLVCKNKVCAKDAASEPECSADKPCADGKDCSAEGKCVDKSSEPECSADKPCADGKDCSAEGKCVDKSSEPECSADKPCADGKDCSAEGKCVDADSRCLSNDDCKDKVGTPYCDLSSHACVAEEQSDDDCGACTNGVCNIDLCVTEDMKAEGQPCDTYDDAFCDGDVLWYCSQEGKLAKENCKDTGFGTCSRYRDSYGKTAQCTGTEEMISHCTGETALLCDPDGMYNYKCVKDLKGHTMAIYDSKNQAGVKDCEKGCEYDSNNAPVCK